MSGELQELAAEAKAMKAQDEALQSLIFDDSNWKNWGKTDFIYYLSIFLNKSFKRKKTDFSTFNTWPDVIPADLFVKV